jgi:hypothetical protein
MKAFKDLRDKHIRATKEGKRFDYVVIDDEPEEATTPSDNDTIEEISSSPTTAAATTIAPAPNTQTNTTATKIKRVV